MDSDYGQSTIKQYGGLNMFIPQKYVLKDGDTPVGSGSLGIQCKHCKRMFAIPPTDITAELASATELNYRDGGRKRREPGGSRRFCQCKEGDMLYELTMALYHALERLAPRCPYYPYEETSLLLDPRFTPSPLYRCRRGSNPW